jgi:hypothetical protein
VKPRYRGGPGPLGADAPWKKKLKKYCKFREFIEDGETQNNKENYGMEIHSFETKRKIQNEVGRGSKACFEGYENLHWKKKAKMRNEF